MKMKPWQYCAQFFGSYFTFFIVVVANMAVFLNGVSLAWSSPILVKLSSTEDNPLGKPLSSQESDLIGSIVYVGAALGPFLFIKSANYLGRKRTITISLLPSFTGYLILIFAERVELYYVARLLIGFSIGGVSSVGPAYLSDIIFSVKNRGPYMAINSPAIQLGYLASYTVGPYVSINLFHSIILIVTLIVTLLIGYCCPESPHYVVGVKGREASTNILKRLEIDDVEKELLQMEKEISEETSDTFMAVFKSPSNLRAFIMATSLLLFQQLSGIGILMAYSQQIFLKSDEILPSQQCSIIVGIIEVLSATLSTVTSRKFSRKSLLLFSLFGSGALDLILGFYYYFEQKLQQYDWVPLIGLILFVIFYNSGLDPLPWVYLGEIYPHEIKSIGTALSASVYWIALCSLSWIFSKVDVSHLFFGYAFCCLYGIFYVKFKLTETKGRTLREIQEALSIA